MAEPLPKVLNKRLRQDNGVYIGRPSIWGNPFEIGRNGTRQEVIDKYEAWMKSNVGLTNKAKSELKGKNLICWCAPLACHGDVLLRIANDSKNTACSRYSRKIK